MTSKDARYINSIANKLSKDIEYIKDLNEHTRLFKYNGEYLAIQLNLYDRFTICVHRYADLLENVFNEHGLRYASTFDLTIIVAATDKDIDYNKLIYLINIYYALEADEMRSYIYKGGNELTRLI